MGVDVMMLRRMLMAKTGGGEMIGEFSKYQKVTEVPENVSDFIPSHTLGVVPKLVIVSCESTDEPYTVAGYIRYGVFVPECGVTKYMNGSNNTISVTGYKYGSPSSNAGYELYDDKVRLHRTSTNGQWSTNTTYTVEFYA